MSFRFDMMLPVMQSTGELTEYAGELAAERAESILREKITEADQRRLFEQSLKDVREVQG